ncbi:hypothetical protein H5T51_07690 [Candidatus Bathyarchaeota archaeon]|nr:hypothetical protein [Candidatus Bathyarchaeota archaeon]
MKRQNVGQIRIIEAFLAIIIIFSAIAISANITNSRGEDDSRKLASMGLNALLILDHDGSLGRYVDSQNWTGLREALKLLLPASIIFNVTVYDGEMHQINGEVIANGALNSQNVAFTEYLCASRRPDFRYYIIHMHLAVAG